VIHRLYNTKNRRSCRINTKLDATSEWSFRYFGGGILDHLVARRVSVETRALFPRRLEGRIVRW